MPPLRMTRAAAVLLLALCAAPLRAQQPAASDPPSPRLLTLADAIAMAQQRGSQAVGARATLSAARYRGHQVFARLLPQLSLVGTVPSYSRAISEVPGDSGARVYLPLEQTNTSLQMQLTQKLPLTGGDLYFSSSLARFQLAGSQSLDSWSSTPFTLGLRQDILRPNVAGWNRREQNVRSDRDERAYREAMEDVAVNVVNLYFAAYAAQANLANARANAAVNDTLFRLNRGRLEIGKIGENDLLQSQLALLRARAAVDAAVLEQERAFAALRIALVEPPGAALRVGVPDSVPAFDVDTARAVAEALKNSSSVSGIRLQQVQAERRVAEARMQDGVGATVQASYGYNATGTTMNLAYNNLLEARQFSLSVSVPLWQFGAHTDGVRAAQADRTAVEAQSRTSLEQVAMDARFAALQLLQARSNLALAQLADSVAGRRFAVAYNRYVIGKILVDNLYIAQQEKDQALNQYVDGLRQYWQAHYRLRRLTLFDFEHNLPLH